MSVSVYRIDSKKVSDSECLEAPIDLADTSTERVSVLLHLRIIPHGHYDFCISKNTPSLVVTLVMKIF